MLNAVSTSNKAEILEESNLLGQSQNTHKSHDFSLISFFFNLAYLSFIIFPHVVLHDKKFLLFLFIFITYCLFLINLNSIN